MAKPTAKPNWTVGNPDFATITVEPSNAKKLAGWLPDERPPREFMNWLFNNLGEWVDYFETTTDAIVTQQGLFDAIVGTGGTHADINALMADPNIANLKNILIASSLAITTPQIINQSGMNFTFHPKATIFKDSSTIGLQIEAERVRILSGRFFNFSAVGDKAIVLTATAKNCMIENTFFKTCDTMIDDLGTNNLLGNNLEEV